MVTLKKKTAFKISCYTCALRFVCFPSSVSLSQLPQLDAMIKKDQIVSSNDSIFLQDDNPVHLFAVRSGIVKSSIKIRDDMEQITGYFLTGDIIGIENIGLERYSHSASVVQEASLCSISMENLKIISKQTDNLDEYFLHLAAQKIRINQENMLSLNQMSALERVAMFILRLAIRYKSKKLSDKQLYLPMSKADISNYLGITPETFSRILSMLKKNKIITVNGRLIIINDKNYLENIFDNKIK